MNLTRTMRMAVTGVLMVLLAAFAHAADIKFSLPVQADGASLGTASGTLTVIPGPPGTVEWKLSDGKFAAEANGNGELKWDEAMLTGSGSANATGAADLKDFDITLQQSTGVDVAYRFRLSATLADGVVKSVTIAKVT